MTYLLEELRYAQRLVMVPRKIIRHDFLLFNNEVKRKRKGAGGREK
jgi:hypothetical protein